MNKTQARIYLPMAIIIWGLIFKRISIPEDNPIMSPFAIFIGVTIGICVSFIEVIYKKTKRIKAKIKTKLGNRDSWTIGTVC